jgi:ribonuclease HI
MSTVYAAELQGINLALEIADEETESDNTRSKLIIFTDNQAAIKTFQNPAGRSGAYVHASAVRLIDKLRKDRRLQVEISWIPARTGIWGNEAADKAAKLAATQHLSHDQSSRNTKRTSNHHLQSTLRTWITKHTVANWSQDWQRETRERATYNYTPQPGHKILRLHQGLRKWQSALLIQMRTEKIGLRDFLFKRKVPGFDDPECECGHGRQTVDHILRQCRLHHNVRRREFGIGRRIDLRVILNEPKSAIKAIRFMEQTRLLGQYRSCVAEQTDEVEHWEETEGMRARED